MNSAQGIASALSALALAMTVLLSMSVSTYEMNSAQVFALIASVFAVLALIGGTLLTEHTYDKARAQHKATLSRYIAHYSQELEREIRARKELSALLKRVERDAQLERENLEHNLSAYKRDLANCRQNYARALATINELEISNRELAGALLNAIDKLD
jgi:septal ring factor EnvC (AmiA/AmiB activator)